MQHGNVLTMVPKREDENADRAPLELAWWKRGLLALGFMKHENEPSINGAALLFAILFSLAMVYIFLGGSVNFLNAIDDKKTDDAMSKLAARRAEDKFNREQEKRAQLIQFMKEKGLYTEIPETLKFFEQAEADKPYTKEK